jgi:hypothetical protein
MTLTGSFASSSASGSVDIAIGIAGRDRDIAAFDISEVSKSGAQRCNKRIYVGRGRGREPRSGHLCLLRAPARYH